MLLVVVLLCTLGLGASSSQSQPTRQELPPRRQPAVEPSPRHTLPFSNTVRHSLAGAISGAVGVTLLAPVEIMRLNMMVDRKLTLRAAFDALRGGWFRGNSADILATAPRIGITMIAFAMYKDLVDVSASAMSAQLGGPAYEPGSKWTVFLAGALAGATAQAYPHPSLLSCSPERPAATPHPRPPLPPTAPPLPPPLASLCVTTASPPPSSLTSLAPPLLPPCPPPSPPCPPPSSP